MTKEVMKQALDALKYCVEQGGGPFCEHESGGAVCFCKENKAIKSLEEALKQEQGEPVACWCHKCNEKKTVNGLPFAMTRMIVCPECGNKRCPKASNHAMQCTSSNEPNQTGSVYTTPQPKQEQGEPVAWEYEEYRHAITGAMEWFPEVAFVQPPNEPTLFRKIKPLYIKPQTKEWVGLTAAELNAISDSMRTWNSFQITDVYFAIEAKLKEKNA